MSESQTKFGNGRGGKSGAPGKGTAKVAKRPPGPTVLDRYSPLGYILLRETKSIAGFTILQEVGKIDKEGKHSFVTLDDAEVELSSMEFEKKEKAKPSSVSNSAAGQSKDTNVTQGVDTSKTGKQKVPQAGKDLAKRCLARFGVPIAFLEKLPEEDQPIAKRLLEASQKEYLSLKLEGRHPHFKKDLETEWSSTTEVDRDKILKGSSPGPNSQAVKPTWW